MQEQNKIKELFDNLSGYIDTKVELVKLDIKSDVSKAILNLLFVFLVLTLVAIVFFLLSFGFAEYLNHKYESSFLGYILLAGFYLLVLASVFLLRKYTNLAVYLRRHIMTFLDLNEKENGR